MTFLMSYNRPAKYPFRPEAGPLRSQQSLPHSHIAEIRLDFPFPPNLTGIFLAMTELSLRTGFAPQGQCPESREENPPPNRRSVPV